MWKVINANSHWVKVLKYPKLNALEGPICTKKKEETKNKQTIFKSQSIFVKIPIISKCQFLKNLDTQSGQTWSGETQKSNYTSFKGTICKTYNLKHLEN